MNIFDKLILTNFVVFIATVGFVNFTGYAGISINKHIEEVIGAYFITSVLTTLFWIIYSIWVYL